MQSKKVFYPKKAHCWEYGIAEFSAEHFDERDLKNCSFDADGVKVFNGEKGVELRLVESTGCRYPSLRVKRKWPEIDENSQEIVYVELEEETVFCFRNGGYMTFPGNLGHVRWL